MVMHNTRKIRLQRQCPRTQRRKGGKPQRKAGKERAKRTPQQIHDSIKQKLKDVEQEIEELYQQQTPTPVNHLVSYTKKWYIDTLQNKKHYAKYIDAVDTVANSLKQDHARWKVCVIDSHRDKEIVRHGLSRSIKLDIKRAKRFMTFHMQAIVDWRKENNIDTIETAPYIDGQTVEEWHKKKGVDDFDKLWPTKTIVDEKSNYLIVIDYLGELLKNLDHLKKLGDLSVPGVEYTQPPHQDNVLNVDPTDKASLQLLMAVRRERLFKQKVKLNKNFRHIQIYDCKGISRLSELKAVTPIFMRAASVCHYYPESLRGVLLFNAPTWVNAAISFVSYFIDPITMNKFQVKGTHAKLEKGPLELTFLSLPSNPLDSENFHLRLTKELLDRA